ncbi:MAG: twin-arginine translocation pathway signal protein [Betaproteobacteria bacterium]|jgi:arylsulfatase A-like enzyme|nr:twin-arginine translocation pathway signal protein [Betaproteobacteria bacterium]
MKQPNIIFIVADDLGFADLGCYGGRDAQFGKVSPVIDALAANGLKFTDGYSNSPVCSPTRFGLMTARYQYRLRGAAEEPINSKSRTSTTLGLPPAHPTLPSLLKGVGYRTALIGKWHLGYPPAFGPLRSGYDEFFGPMAGGVDYFTHCASSGAHDLWVGEEEQPHEGYLTDLISKQSVDFVKRMSQDKSKPFFLSMHYTAPHWPWETRDDHALAQTIKDNIFHLQGGNIHTYHRMIHHMDEGIGWVVQALKDTDQLENTLIVFTSDNGGERFSDNWPLVGGKMDLTEGGIRVPWVAHWPQGIAPGGISEQHCMTMDWSATMIEVAGAKPDADYPLDGVSLLPVLKNPAQIFDRPMYWRMNHRGQRAMRVGDWKYLRVDGHDYLFNIPADARERANLGRHQPEKLDGLRAQWEAWNQTMPAIPADATISLGFSAKDMPQR